MTQFVAVKFGGSGRSYTYRNDGARVSAGESVIIIGRGGAEQIVKVEEVTAESPGFATKAIVGRAECRHTDADGPCGTYPAITILDGEPLCQKHADAWARAEDIAAL